MKYALYISVMLFAASSAAAQDDDASAAETGLVGARLVGDESPRAPELLRPQLVYRDHSTAKIIGGIAAVTGGIALVASWSIYIARQNYRQQAFPVLTNDVISTWSSLGAWSLWTGVGASALLVTSEYLLLPESQEVPVLAWFAGAGGLTLAAVGVGFWAGGTHCGPQAIRPGADIRLACSSGTADGIFGVELILTSLPIINIPLTYLFRKLFAGAPESLSFGVGTVSLRGRF